MLPNQSGDIDPDAEFLMLSNMQDFTQEQLNQSMDNIEEIMFDSFGFFNIL